MKTAAALLQSLKACAWRRAIGLVAAYALALQAFFATGAATQAFASGQAAGTFFVLCIGGDEVAAPDGVGAPAKAATHCPVCTLATGAAAPAPEAAVLPVWPVAAAARAPFVTAQACIASHRARSGLTRAPPQNA